MSSASEIILEYICPIAGGIMATVMFAAPLRDAHLCSKHVGDLGELNPTPWAFMLGNCFGWVTYGILIRNFFVFCANTPGFVFAVWLNLQAVQLLAMRSTELRSSLVAALPREMKDYDVESSPLEDGVERVGHDRTSSQILEAVSKVQTLHLSQRRTFPHEFLVLAMVLIWMGIASFLVFADSVSSATKENIVGIAVNMNLVVFYGAPLSTIWRVLRTQSSVSIHIPTMLTNTANGTFWSAYGAAIQDYFILVPNGLGALLGVVQIVLCVVFPRRSDDAPGNTSLSTEEPAVETEEGANARLKDR